jgi:hypothetical protein
MAADDEVGWTRPEVAEHVGGEHSTFTSLLDNMAGRPVAWVDRRG